MTDDNIGSAIGSLIGLGIGVVLAKKIVDTIGADKVKKRISEAKKKKPMTKAHDWVAQETGGWN